MKTLSNFPVIEKNVLLRVDLNIPVNNGIITDKTRLYAIKSTVRDLCLKKNKIFLLSHFGRPNGQFRKNLSLEFLKDILADVLSVKQIYFLSSCYGETIHQQQNKMQPGDICLLENVRFHKEEENNDFNFSLSLSKHFDIYVNDAFSASHRTHASVVGVTEFLPSLAGNCFINEIKNLDLILNKPIKLTTAIIGGSKTSTKLKLLNNLIESFDTLILGGAMANTFLLSQGFNMGKSLVEKDLVINAKEILDKANDLKTNVILPLDLVCSNNIANISNIQSVDVQNVSSGEMALDIGNKTLKLIKSYIIKSNLILWNGPLGAFEIKPFDNSSNFVAEIIKKYSQKSNVITIAGGGDTIAAIKKVKAEKYFSYISTAGGAFLEWLEGNGSPGYKALKENSLY